MKKYLLAIIVIVLLSAGIVVGLILVQQQQLFNQKASTPTGTATISITPGSGTFERNTDNQVSVYFNTGGNLIKGIAARISYANLGVKASNLVVNPDLASQGFSCGIQTIAADLNSPSIDNIDISCFYATAGTGFDASGDVLLATFVVNASQVPLVNPVIFSFDPTLTVITEAASATDIALTPSSTGSYTILDSVGGATDTPVATAQATATATSQATVQPTATATATATTLAQGLTPTPTSTTSTGTNTATKTPTATPKVSGTPAALPASGVSTPTILAGAAGMILLFFAAAALIL